MSYKALLPILQFVFVVVAVNSGLIGKGKPNLTILLTG